MIVIIPIGGTGQRFKKNGYSKPKALIHVYGRPMIYYLLDNLNLDKVDYVYIPYNKEYANYNFESRLMKDYPKINFKFYCIQNNTRGAAETINVSLINLNEQDDKPVLCLDSDNFYHCDVVSKWNGQNCVFSITDTSEAPIFSYIDSDENGQIIEIKEKVKISDFACTGAYGFSSVRLLQMYTSKIIENNIRQKSEFYTSGVIQEMINGGNTFQNINIDKEDFICLGTPIQLKTFYHEYPKMIEKNDKLAIRSSRICFDFDNTLVTFPLVSGDYTSVQPIKKNIAFLKYLKKFNNTIIIYTARRMKTHRGNIGKVNADIGKITFDTLEKFDIPYDEVHFGKPNADFYIDDLAVNCFDDLNKELGYYNDDIEPRDFNSIKVSSVEIITKTGENLSGEIYYYSNIPNDVKDLFPMLLSNGNNIYQVEKINGLTLSELHVSELLTESMLHNMLNSLLTLQSATTSENKDIDIYENYASKIQKRYQQYNYSEFKGHESIYNELLEAFEKYESENCGKKTVIHGDPVFTNILINHSNKIKFIDMRGRVGDELTICGDWLYDWAKVYQSLIGYDEILLNKPVSDDYKQKMIQCFITFFLEHFSENDLYYLKLITKSLLFTLLPLHHNEKCKAYYELISSDFLHM